jgi:two-component sensor histidine kinase
LIIADNGIGFADFDNFDKSKSLGMFLIKNFAKRQLKGTLEITSAKGEGLKYEIIF